MRPVYHVTTTEKVINESASLTEFYNLTNKLSATRYVRFTGKNDDADNIEWRFTYRGRKLSLQYNIYSGVSLQTDNTKNISTINKLAEKLGSFA